MTVKRPAVPPPGVHEEGGVFRRTPPVLLSFGQYVQDAGSEPGRGSSSAWQFPAAMPPPTMPLPADGQQRHTSVAAGADIPLINQYLRMVVQDSSSQSQGDASRLQPNGGADNLQHLQLDRPALSRRGVPNAVINRLYRVLQSNAAAFEGMVAREQRRLSNLLSDQPGFSTAERLLAYVQGVEAALQEDVSQYVAGVAASAAPIISTGAAEPATDGPLEAGVIQEMNMQEAGAMAAMGNVVGLRLMLEDFRRLHVRQCADLKSRLQHETQRAQRLQEQADALRNDLNGSRMECEQQHKRVTEAVAEAERLQRQCEVLQASLRVGYAQTAATATELATLQATWQTATSQEAARIKAQLQDVVDSTQGAEGLRATLLEHQACLISTRLALDAEAARSRQLASQLDLERKRRAAEAQERLDGTGLYHKAEQLAAAAEGWAVTNDATLSSFEHQLQHERAVHQRTRDRLHAQAFKTESARCALVDLHAHASHMVREAVAASSQMALKALRAERQAAECTDVIAAQKREISDLGVIIEGHGSRVQSLFECIQEKDAVIVKADLRRVELENEVSALDQQQRAAQARCTALTATLTKLQAVEAALQAELHMLQQYAKERLATLAATAQAQSQLSKLQAEHEETCQQLTSAVAEVARTASFEEELTDLRGAHEELEQQHSVTVKELEVSSAGLLESQQRASHLQQEVHRLVPQLHAAQHAATQAHMQLLEAQQILAATQSDLTACNAALAEDREENKYLTDQVRRKSTLVEQLRLSIADLELQLGSAKADRVYAMAQRDAWMAARQYMTHEMREWLSRGQDEAAALCDLCQRLMPGLTQLLAGLVPSETGSPGVTDGSNFVVVAPSRLVLRQLCSDLENIVQRSVALLSSDTAARAGAEEHIQALEAGVTQRVDAAQGFWTTALDHARSCPPEQLSSLMGAAAASVSGLDPLSPLTSLVPVGLLESMHKEAESQRMRIGALLGQASAATQEMAVTQKVLERERQASDIQQEKIASVMSGLRSTIAQLKRDVLSALGTARLHERHSSDLAGRLEEVEWRVATAASREAARGSRFMPAGRSERGTQTNWSEMFVSGMSSPPAGGSSASGGPRPQSAFSPVPSWASELGCGSVAMPGLASVLLMSTTAAPAFPTRRPESASACLTPSRRSAASAASATQRPRTASPGGARPQPAASRSLPRSGLSLVPSQTPASPLSPHNDGSRPPSALRPGSPQALSSPTAGSASAGLSARRMSLPASDAVAKGAVMSLQQTLDVVTDVFRCKVEYDASVQDKRPGGACGGLTLQQYLVLYYDSKLQCEGPQSQVPTPGVQLAASVAAHAQAHDLVAAFGRSAGLLPHSSTAGTTGESTSRLPGFAAESSPVCAGGRDGRPHSSSSSSPAPCSAGSRTSSPTYVAGQAAVHRSAAVSPRLRPRSAFSSVDVSDAASTMCRPRFTSSAGTPPGGGLQEALAESALDDTPAGAAPGIESLIQASLTESLRALYNMVGVDALMAPVRSGQVADLLSLHDLGTPVFEHQDPELHHLLCEVADKMALEVAPDVYECPALAAAAVNGHAAPSHVLLHLPHVSNSLIGTGSRLRRLPTGSLGWRRRAVVLLRPGLLQAMEAQELQAVLATTLAPMLLPGGGGHRMDTSHGLVAEPVELEAVADVMTAVALAAIKPSALLELQPAQVQMQWPRLCEALHHIVAAAEGTCDRIALLMVRHIGPVATAIAKDVRREWQAPVSAEALLQQAAEFDPRSLSSSGAAGTPAVALLRIHRLLAWQASPAWQSLSVAQAPSRVDPPHGGAGPGQATQADDACSGAAPGVSGASHHTPAHPPAKDMTPSMTAEL